MKDVNDAFAKLMVTLAEAYPSVRLREGTIRVYAQQLSDLSLEQVELAMSRAVKESEFFPTVACLRRMVAPTTDDAGLLAWAALQQAAADIGAWASLQFEDPRTAEALLVVFGSWPAYCELEGPALGARRSEFLAAYRQAQRHQYHTAWTRVIGLCEAQSSAQALVGGGEVIGRVLASGQVLTVTAPERKALT